MEIYTVLKADHKLVKQILKKLEKTEEADVRDRRDLLMELKQELVPHARAEEVVLYDRLKMAQIKEADTLAFEAYEEHAVVDRLLEQLTATSPEDKRWTALLSVAKENIEHHIKEEEEALFEKAKKAFERSEAVQMTEEFNDLKAGYLKEVKAGKTPQQKPSREKVKAA